MEWVETTAKTIEEARERVLEVLGVAEEDAEVEVLEEPRAGLFGLIRGEARVRARVRPTEVRPKIDRRRGRRARQSDESVSPETASGAEVSPGPVESASEDAPASGRRRRRGSATSSPDADEPTEPVTTPDPTTRSDQTDETDPSVEMQENADMDSNAGTSEDLVSPDAVGRAAVVFMEGLVDAFDLSGEVTLSVDDTELEVEVAGSELGLLIGPGGRTLLAVQDLARVAAQRRLGDHETRLRIDVAGYRLRRRAALERFARSVAAQVTETGRARSLEPMPSADRKVIHDVLMEIEGVTSRSEGDDPDRRVVVLPQ